MESWEIKAEEARKKEVDLSLKLIKTNWGCDFETGIWTNLKYLNETFTLQQAAERAGLS